MAKTDQQRTSRRKAQTELLPFTATNYWIRGGGLALIIAGYVALSQSPWDGVMPLVVAPILLVLGYVIVIPYGILHRDKTTSTEPTGAEGQAPKASA